MRLPYTYLRDPRKFPFWSGRGYTPEPASPEQMAALHRALHIERVVIVTPSVYGTDNSATLYGMRVRGATARGIAVIGPQTSEAELDAMNRAGIRGIRINLGTASELAVVRRRFTDAVSRVASRGWHIQMLVSPAAIPGIRDLIASAPVPVVFDHFASAKASAGLNQPGFPELLELVRSGKAWVKISGAYRASNQPPDYPDVVPLAKALIGANPDRIVWGTDWPHPDSAKVAGRKPTDVSKPVPVDDARLLDQLPVWAPDPAVRKKILVDNPARLYGF